MEFIERLGTLTLVVDLAEKRSAPVGHTLMQKLVYLLQQALHQGLGYRFRLYHYGPYCEDVWADLQTLDNMGALSVSTSPDGYGFVIKTKDRAQQFIEAVDAVALKQQIRDLLAELGGQPVSRLELVATTHFMQAELRRRGHPASEADLVRNVLALKPHFNDAQVVDALRLLSQKGWLE